MSAVVICRMNRDLAGCFRPPFFLLLSCSKGSASVDFPEGVVDPATATTGRRSRRMTSGRYPGQRRLQSAPAAATSTVTIADAQFNTHGQASDAVDSGVTSIRVTATGDGEVCVCGNSLPARRSFR